MWDVLALYARPAEQALAPANPQSFEPSATHQIPLQLLARQDPVLDRILFYDDVPLYEDELHDHGGSELGVRVRVMPHAFFVLARLFVRVDAVVFRILDTRVFHAFGSNEVIRESNGMEAPYEAVKSVSLPLHSRTELTSSTSRIQRTCRPSQTQTSSPPRSRRSRTASRPRCARAAQPRCRRAGRRCPGASRRTRRRPLPPPPRRLRRPSRPSRKRRVSRGRDLESASTCSTSRTSSRVSGISVCSAHGYYSLQSCRVRDEKL